MRIDIKYLCVLFLESTKLLTEDQTTGVSIPYRSRIFSSQPLSYWLWGPLSLLLCVYRGYFPRWYCDRRVNL